MGEWKPIETAPKDGRVILVSHEEVGAFPMAWNRSATNHLFAPGEVGMWEMVDQSMTWRADEDGPSRWMPLPEKSHAS